LGFLGGIRALTSFFTIIPTGRYSLTEAANYMPLSPLIGMLIGLSAGLISWLLMQVFTNLISGMLTLGFLLFLTGLHHTDGLLDFGDGLMCQGSPERKIEAMRNGKRGTGGLTLGLVTLMTTALAISYIEAHSIIQSLIIAEVSAKQGMVVLAWTGKSAHQGLNTCFIDAMHGKNRVFRLTISFTLSLAVVVPLLGLTGVIALLIGSITALVILWVSNRHFGGLTGDVFGATNDLGRLTSLLTLLAMRP
jgi:adenosylcobinamide-GDP ribazoletransferase